MGGETYMHRDHRHAARRVRLVWARLVSIARVLQSRDRMCGTEAKELRGSQALPEDRCPKLYPTVHAASGTESCCVTVWWSLPLASTCRID